MCRFSGSNEISSALDITDLLGLIFSGVVEGYESPLHSGSFYRALGCENTPQVLISTMPLIIIKQWGFYVIT